MSRIKILSTKQLNPSIIENAKLDGIDITCVPFITIKPLAEEGLRKQVKTLWSSVPAVVFTSANAVRSVKSLMGEEAPSSNPSFVFTTEGETASRFRKDFPALSIYDTAPNATGLAEKIVRAGIETVAFFCGDKRRDELPGILQQHKIIVHESVVYETIPGAEVIKGEFDGILFFSPSAVESFFSANHPGTGIKYFAIGNTTAAAVSEYTDSQVVHSTEPSQNALITLVKDFFKKTIAKDE